VLFLKVNCYINYGQSVVGLKAAIRKNYMETAKKEKEGIISKAGEEANKLLVRAKQDIKNEKESAIEQMRDQISDLVIKAAEKIINENLDDAKQKKIINDFLSRVNKN